jgi:hypothetical protein
MGSKGVVGPPLWGWLGRPQPMGVASFFLNKYIYLLR